MSNVSIVLPSYNGEKYIRESIESIIKQSFRNWELLLVDDCSEDMTLQIMMEYQDRDPRIRVIHNTTNQNLPKSLNIGFSYAKYELLTWTSDDNIYEENALFEMVCALKKDDSSMIIAKMHYIDEYGKIKGEAPEFDDSLFWYNNNVGACFLYSRDVLNTVGEYNSEMFGVEDYDYWIRVMNVCRKIKFINKFLYRYRIHGKSLSNVRFYDIKNKLNMIRKNNIKQLLKNMTNQAEKMGLYFDCMLSEGDFYKIFYVDEARFYKNFNSDKKNLVYGAGEYGRRAKFLLGEIEGFVDSNPQKIGTYFEGKKVMSFDDYYNNYRDFQLVVSVDAINLFSIAKQYAEYSELSFTTFHQAVHELKYSTSNV